MEKNRLEFSPMYGTDYLALLPIGVMTVFGWLCFIKGWAFVLPFVMIIAILFGIVFPGWILFMITTKIRMDPHGISRKTWFSERSMPWEEVQTVLLYTEKSTTTVILANRKIDKPCGLFDSKPERYFSFTHRRKAEEYIVLMLKNRIPIDRQKKGFGITDLKDIADFFR